MDIFQQCYEIYFYLWTHFTFKRFQYLWFRWALGYSYSLATLLPSNSSPHWVPCAKQWMFVDYTGIVIIGELGQQCRRFSLLQKAETSGLAWTTCPVHFDLWKPWLIRWGLPIPSITHCKGTKCIWNDLKVVWSNSKFKKIAWPS